SLSSTLIEMSHYQYFFMHHLPSLTDFGSTKDENDMMNFLLDLALSSKKAPFVSVMSDRKFGS
ncbi:MAG: hypothetical protein ACKOE6_10925, partial [Flammeovirgaceae bacterium]